MDNQPQAFWVNETWTNETEHYGIGESDWYETYEMTLGALFRKMWFEYGRCVSKMYRDRKDAPPIVIGWVFEKRVKYEDVKETFVRVTWVEVSTTKPIELVNVGNKTSPWEKVNA